MCRLHVVLIASIHELSSSSVSAATRKTRPSMLVWISIMNFFLCCWRRICVTFPRGILPFENSSYEISATRQGKRASQGQKVRFSSLFPKNKNRRLRPMRIAALLGAWAPQIRVPFVLQSNTRCYLATKTSVSSSSCAHHLAW